MVTIEFQSGPIARATEATYVSAEFALNYRHRPELATRTPRLVDAVEEALGVRRPGDSLVIAKTLTLVFSAETRELVAFDAYTNLERWERTDDVAVPSVSGAGALHLLESLPDGRIDLPVDPRYRYSDSRSLLRIDLSLSLEEPIFYRLSDRLVVGVQRRVLSSLLVLDLEVR